MADFDHISGSNQAGMVSIADLNAQRIELSVERTLMELESDSAPFDTMMRMLGPSISVTNPEHRILEEAPIKNKTTVTAAFSNSATTITVLDSSFMIPSLTLMVKETGEHIWINNTTTITDSTGTITNCVRGIGSSKAQAIQNGDTIIVVSPALEEGQDPIESRSRITGDHQMFHQIIQEAYELSEQSAKVGVYGISELFRQQRGLTKRFRRSRNRNLLLGTTGKDTTSGTDTVYFAGGLREWCSQYNNIDAGESFTRRTITAAAQRIMQNSGGMVRNFKGVTSQKVWAEISELEKGMRRTTRTDTTLGIEVNTITFTGGSIDIVVDWTLDEAGFDDEMLLFAPEFTRIGHFIPVRTKKGVQTNGAMRQKDIVYVQEGLHAKSPLTMGRIYNLQYGNG